MAIPITTGGGVLMHTAGGLPLQHTLSAIKHNCKIEELGEHMLTNSEKTRSQKNSANCFRRMDVRKYTHR